MRASLASATSLLALLLLEGHHARAAAVITLGAPSVPFVLVNPVTPGTGSVTDVATVSGQTQGSILTFGALTGTFSGATQNFTAPSTATFSATASYTFSPAATGNFSTTVSVTDSAGGGPKILTLSGTGVAPVAVGPATTTPFGTFVLVGQTASATLNVGNTGNGSLASPANGSLNSLSGSITGGNSVFVGTASTFNLADNTKGATISTASQSFGFTFKPTIIGTQSTTVVTTFSNGAISTNNAAASVTTTLTGTAVAPVQSVSPAAATVYTRVGTSSSTAITIANIGNGNLAGTGTASNLTVSSINPTLGSGFKGSAGNVTSASLADSASTTLNYTYTPISRGVTASTAVSITFDNGNSAGTNLSQSVASTLTGNGVGPVFAGSIKGGAVSTPTAGANGSIIAASKTIQFGSVGDKVSQTVYLELQNTSTDANGGLASLTDLSILRYSIGGGSTSAFSVPAGSGVLHENNAGFIEIPITVIGTSAVGSLNDTLTIFTDESVGFGGTGDTFTYALTAFSVPEPASLAALGVGLAGLASVRRRRIPVRPTYY